MRRGLSAVLAGLGGVAILAGSHDVLRGALGVRGTRTTPVDPSLDSELRFFAAWYVVAGALMVRAARAPEREGSAVRLISAGWFVAALGRLLSLRSAGRPHELYVALTAAELVIAGGLVPWQQRVERAAQGDQR